MTDQTKSEIERLAKVMQDKVITKYRISKDLQIPEMTVRDFFSLKKIPSMENYLRVKEYLEG